MATITISSGQTLSGTTLFNDTTSAGTITLSPGDVVWLGTGETATFGPGQVVEITIDGIGTLANPVVQETLS